MVKQLEKEASTRSAAGEKERFLHHGKLMESIRKTGNGREMHSRKQISGNFRLHAEYEWIEEGGGKKMGIYRGLVWWTVIHTYVWSTGACMAMVVFWEPELCSKIDNKGEGRIDRQQQKKKQAKHRRQIPSLWPRGNLHWSFLQKSLWTEMVDSCRASNFESTSALLSYLLTGLTIFPFVSHVEHTSCLWV